MKPSDHDLARSVRSYCARLGADPLLVQGAGGNVSWKEGDVLWVKASGTWLAEAERADVFVPVDMGALRKSVAAGDFGAVPRVLGEARLRPSIETSLHGLMPWRVVVHVHAIEVLARLVRREAREEMERCLGPTGAEGFVPYRKPGVELARAVAGVLAASPDCRVVCLMNHGIVVGGDDVEDVDARLRGVLESCATPPLSPAGTAHAAAWHAPPGTGYVRCADRAIELLAIDPGWLSRVRSDWALYPDHVVFLGPAAVVRAEEELPSSVGAGEDAPPFVFVAGKGVLQRSEVTAAQVAQLRCYYEVIRRQADGVLLATLGDAEIEELMNWDSEKYRQALSRGMSRP